MKANQVWTKLGRTAVALAVIGGLLATSAVSAFASASDNGGNGEGTLAIFTNQNLSKGTSNLNSGGTYYIELLNPGGGTRLTQLRHVPATLTFNFFTPAVNFQGNPGKSKDTPAATVQGTEVGTRSPYIYKVTLPANLAQAYYTIETGAPMSNGGKGEDEFYFSTDPSINNNQGVQILNPAGQLPEMPYPVVIPALLLVGAVTVFSLRRKAAAKH